uniref:Ninein-like n=1 Tax=Tetraodon nigroviridis TaxID=99883 RepID=H3C8L9_TETNG
MEDDDHERYISQLRLEFAGCDASASGSLGREELTALCHKLHLEAHLQPLLDTLLGQGHRGRVNFEEFKDGFVAVLSRSLDFSTSEDDSSYLEPVAPEEVRPKFVKGKKRYGRRSRPDKPGGALSQDPEDLGPSAMESSDLSPSGIRRAKLRRSTSLESIESLKSDVEPANQEKSEGPLCCPTFIFLLFAKQQVCTVCVCCRPWAGGGCGAENVWSRSGQRLSSAHRRQRNALDAKCDVGVSVHCKCPQELLQKLDSDLDGGVSRWDFHPVRNAAPLSSSTPSRCVDLRKAQAVPDEHSGRSTTPSLLMATVGQRVLSRLDDGTGCCSPEQVVTLWTEEGIRSSREILQTLDFSLEDRLSLVDLTLALDNELLVSGNGIHQAALISYKNEIQHLQVLAEQACRERDKVKADLDQADQRNLQLVREVDDRHASMENLNQSRIRDLEQEFRDRLTAVRSQAEQESELLLQQAERERGSLQEELWLLRAQEAALQEELGAAAQENAGLEQELQLVKLQLTEAQNSVSRLQKDLDQLLNDKSEPFAGCGLSLDERFSDLIKEYEQQCRELRDRNDELSSELELLQSQRSTRRMQRERAEMEQNFAREIGNLVQRLSCEKEQLEAELKLQMDQEVSLLREKAEQQLLHMELQQAHSGRSLLRQLHCERQQMQEQSLQVSQSEASLEALQVRCGRAEEELEAARARSSELEARLTEACAQLEESIVFLEEKSSVEEELGLLKRREEELLQQVQQLRAELEDTHTDGLGFSSDVRHTPPHRLLPDGGAGGFAEDPAELQLDQMSTTGQALEKTLEEERARNLELQEEREEVGHLRQEKQTYAGLADQLSAQIVEMEEEICTLRDHLREVSSQLDQTSNLVLHLRTQLNAKTAEADRLRTSSEKLLREVQQLSDQLKVKSGDLAGTTEQLLQLQEALVDSESHLRLAEDNFEQEKQRMTRQLVEMEALVLALEEAMDPAGPRRTRLEEVRSENITLQERLRAVQQEVHNMEEDAAKKRRKLEELERDAERSRAEEEQLHKENSTYREEVLDLSSRNLQLSKDNAELSARFRGDQESVRLLQERLVTVSREQEEGEELSTGNRKLTRENAELHHALEEQEEQISSLQEESLKLQQQNQQLQGQAARADEVLSLVQVQQQRGEDGAKVEELQTRLLEEQRRRTICVQDQYEKALSGLQQRVQELDTKLRGVQMVLQEKVQQLKELLVKNTKSSSLVKELYVENAQLMTALQVTEQRQKSAEKKSFLLEGKVSALNKLLREVVHVALAT